MYDTSGRKIDVAYLVLQPLCLALCSTQLTTSGVDTDTLGGGDVTGATTSTTQSPSAALNK